MGQAIFGANNLNNPNSTVIGGSSLVKERAARDIKLSSRNAKSNMPLLAIRNDADKKIVGRITP